MSSGAFIEFIDQASQFIGQTAQLVDGLDARTAFFVGIATWFLVEQAIRRLAGVMRVAILATALAGSGVAVGTVAMLALQPAPAVSQVSAVAAAPG